MTVNRAIYQHFSQDDIPFIDKGLEWIKRVEDTYAPVLTPFINPHQEQILRVLAGTYGLGYQSSGDFLPTESVRVLLYPEYRRYQTLKWPCWKFVIRVSLNN